MRTTIDIDEDLLNKLREAASRERVPFKHLLNSVLRRGLAQSVAAGGSAYACPSFDMGPTAPGINLDKALALVDDFEESEVARKLNARK